MQIQNFDIQTERRCYFLYVISFMNISQDVLN